MCPMVHQNQCDSVHVTIQSKFSARIMKKNEVGLLLVSPTNAIYNLHIP